MAEYNTRDRSKLFKSGLVDTADIKDSAVTLDKLAPEVVAEYANKTYVDTAVANVIDSAPGVLDTLNELAAAIGDDANFITTINTSIATKLASADFDSTFDTRLATKTTDDVAEGTNLYYTEARVDANIAAKSTDDIAEGSNLYYTSARANSDFDTRLATKDTGDVAEGTNLYFTDARVQTKLGNISGHLIPDANITYDLGSSTYRFRDLYLSGNTIYLDGITLSNDQGTFSVLDENSSPVVISLAANTTDELTEGSTNLYYTEARVDANIASKTTDDIAEGSSNLYFTTARARASVSASDGVTYNSSTGEFTLTDTGVTAGTYGSASLVPVIEVNANGQITSASTVSVAGVSDFSYTAATNTFTIDTADGGSFSASGNLTSFDTGDLAEGTNLYYTEARVDANIASKTTDDITEGSSNQYYTNARAQSAISTSGPVLTYSSGTIGLTEEAIQDVVGAMVSSNTESGINVTYNDAGNVIDFAVDTSTIATRTYVDSAITAVIDAAPAALDTLNELAAAINDDANYAATVTTALSTKADNSTTVTAGSGLTGGGTLGSSFTISHADTSSQVSVDNTGNTFIQDIALDGFGHITGITSGTVTVGDGAMTVTAGSGLTGGGQLGTANQSGASSVTISHADTSSVSDVSSDNSNGVVIQDVALTFDTYGHVTVASVSTVDLDGRYYTESEADSRFVNVTGDTMSGILSFSANTGNKIDFYYSGEDRYGIQVQSSELRIHSGAQGSGSGGITFGKSTSSVFSEYMRVVNDGYVNATNSFRAPIFYDSNNTGYYVDPNSSSNINLLTLYGHDNQLKINTYAGGASGWFAQENGANKWETYHYSGRYRFYNYTTANEEAFFDNASGYLQIRTSVRAPIFYDSNNTGYYVDPASTSRLNNILPDQIELYAGKIQHGSGTGGTSFSSNHYSQGMDIANGWGNWSYPYKDYIIGHHTGVRIGGHYSYGGTRFYNNSPTTDADMNGHGDGGETLLFSTGMWDNNVRSHVTMYAPFIYDLDDTGYYVDPNAGSSLKYMVLRGPWGGSPFGSGHEQLAIRSSYPSYTLRNTDYGNYWLIHHAADATINWYGGGGGVDGSNWNRNMYLDMSGNFTARGNITAYSDQSLKTNVVTIDNALEKALKLRGVYFDWIDSNQHSIGMIAQEVEQVIPEVVHTNEECDPYTTDVKRIIKSVDYSKLTSVLIEAIKEQQTIIESQETRMNEQDAKIKRLEDMVQKLLNS